MIQHVNHSCVCRRCKLTYSIGVAVGFIICSCVLLVNDGMRENYSQDFKYVPSGSKLPGAMDLAFKSKILIHVVPKVSGRLISGFNLEFGLRF